MPPRSHPLPLCAVASTKGREWDWYQHPVDVRDSWSVGEMDLRRDTAKLLLSTESHMRVSRRTLALRKRGVLDLETRQMRPTLALNKGRRRAVVSKNGEIAWVGAHLGQALNNLFTFPNNPRGR